MSNKKSLRWQFFRVKRKVCRSVMHLVGARPDSSPFVSGDTFRKFADHVYDESDRSLQVGQVKNGDVIFVKIDFVRDFFAQVHPKIDARYVLVTHNGDDEIGDDLAGLVDDKVMAWFAQNVLVKHDKIIPIPIGLENQNYCGNGMVRNFASARSSLDRSSKADRVLYGFSVGTNPAERGRALEVLGALAVADRIGGWPVPIRYLDILKSYKFVASPPGNGVDCIRTWEAMLLEVVPIVKRGVMTEYFFGLGLPMLLVDDWNEVAELDETGLRKKYDELKGRFGSPYLEFAAWWDMVDAARGGKI